MTLTYDVITKCQCIKCPVQTGSECSKPKIAARIDMMNNLNSGSLQNILNTGMLKNAEMVRSMSREQMQAMSDEMKKNTPGQDMEKIRPKPEDMPGPYCANGAAACTDLDFNKMCICGGCQVFKELNLSKAKPNRYFCKDGKAT